ncbi:UNVERIFIED_CONTAM: hypothetical protein GTU68_053727, partial [Idotea baltica]|nr:hypothetical protein [Idotea baltica]
IASPVSRYHLPYRSLFGGAIAILSSHFREVNGFSNRFSGWGGEDDDFSARLSQKGLEFIRFDPRVARYVMMPHIKHSPALDRWRNLDISSFNTSTNDGLSTLNYKLVDLEVFPLYTHIKVK